MMEICLMLKKKKMKSSIKEMVVEYNLKSSKLCKEFTIDSEIFNDCLIEAATRFIEEYIKGKNAALLPTFTVFEKKDSKNINRHATFNSYFAVVNAGFYKKAEIFRQNFIKMSGGIDLKKQSVYSYGTENKPT